MTTISGILTNGANQPIDNSTIILQAKKTTSNVIEDTYINVDVVNGHYSVDLLPCNYDAYLISEGYSKNYLGCIQILADSRNGSLNDFLLNPSESEITPAILQQVVEARDTAKKSANDAKTWASTIDTSTLVKKTGDTVNGQIALTETSAGVKFLYDNGNAMVLRTGGDVLTFMYYDAETNRWWHKLQYLSNANSWQFINVNDVTINNKSVLKIGDAVNFGGNLSDKNLNELNGLSAGFYFQNLVGLAITEKSYPINEAGSLIVIQSGAAGKEACSQIYTASKTARQFIRNYFPATQTWGLWVEQITTAIATVDSNGFYKQASPILRLFANENIELIDGFTQVGCGLVNDLAEGVTAKRIDVGHYEIRGSLGFSKEGWYIQLPEDANGNKKFFVEYSVNKKNVITVKTYTKKFDFEKCEVVAGDPIDIADGRWIDIRLEMPVIETVENEQPIPSVLAPVVAENSADAS